VRTWQCWTVAVLVTIGSAVWQRMSGPTHPATGTAALGAQSIHYRFERAEITGRPLPVTVRVPDGGVTGEVAWRRYPSPESWSTLSLRREGECLTASLPTQPMAGKVEYQVRLHKGQEASVALPAKPAVARFRRHVPEWLLVPHILAMFAGMLLSTRAGLEACLARPNVPKLAVWAFGLLLVGGNMLGPAVQKYAFDAWWTGVPWGWDLTDNKTLIAVMFWLWAMWSLRGGKQGRLAVALAAVSTLVVFTIPHSTWGSQLDWSKVPPSRTESSALPPA
jgi:hypothetical protein